MQNILRNTPMGDRSTAPWILLLILVGYVLAALVLFQIISQIIILPFFNFSFKESLAALTNPYENESARLPLLIIQGITSIGTFILTPLFFINRNLKLKSGEFFDDFSGLKPALLMTAVIMFCFMVSNSIVIEWNQKIDLPESLSVFENWAQAKEAQLEKLTIYLTKFDGIGELLIGMVIIAIIPAVGEELLFRGLIQNLFQKSLGNAHVAIWISAFIFGAFHMQFYGVIPRMLLGALFGYLYYWSGNLSLAMIGHFINNGFTLIMLYIAQKDMVDFDPLSNEPESSPPIYVVMIFFVVGSILLYLFRNYFKAKNDA